MKRYALTFVLFFAAASVVQAHPVPRGQHDRTIAVRLQADKNQLLVDVSYRLEVDELTVKLDDLQPFLHQLDFTRYKNKQGAVYNEFSRIYAGQIAERLVAKFGDQALIFTCVDKSHTLRDEKDQALGHLRCDFKFQAAASCEPGQARKFQFREINYLLKDDAIDLTLASDGRLKLSEVMAPDAALIKREIRQRQPGDDDRLRFLQAIVEFPIEGKAAATVDAPNPKQAEPEGHEDLLHLFLEADYSIWVLLVLAVFLGAAHALTPGHGKTLVAAYLVGENGTTWHAVALGLVTTLTHTGAVMVLALLLWIFFPSGMSAAGLANIQAGLGLAMGMLIVCMGFWLLYTRLAGRADHVHLPGTGHHHHHGDGHHHHGIIAGAPNPVQTHHHHHATPPGAFSWWGLVVLGITGGIVPCWDAVFILLLAIGHDRGWLAFPLVLAFSAGLASVLVALGIIVVHAKRLAQSTWGEGRLVRGLPLLSAVCVIVLGFYLCYESVRSTRPTQTAAVALP